MSASAVVLVIISTFMHAGWNLLVRRRGGVRTCFWRMQIVIVVLGALPAIVGLFVLRGISGTAALCLLGSGVCCGFYYVCLARSYETGDFTTVYPAARALPVVLVGLGDALRGRAPNGIGWLGIGLVAAGCLFVPLTSFKDISLRHYRKAVIVWIVLTALGTVGYSLFDKVGTEAIPRGPAGSALYCYLFFVAAAAFFFPLRKLILRPATDERDPGWRVPAVAGVLGFLAYWLVLWAYQMTPRASYVVAFRQFSIVIGVGIALVAFNEPGRKVRLAGSLVITLGLVIVKVFGS